MREFVEGEIIPRASEYEAADRFPEEIVQGLRELGLFGFTIPEQYGGMGLDLTTYCLAIEEISRGWMSISGIVNTHFICSSMLLQSGTEEQRERLLPTDGDRRGARRVLDDRAPLRLRRAGDPLDRRPRRRRVGRVRPEDVGHERPALRRSWRRS